MTMIASTPSNKNFLSPLGFKFSIKRAPHVNYFVQSVSLPSVSVGEFSFPTPFVKMPIAGDHLTFTPLDLTFKVDEDLQGYLEIFNWIQAIGFPDNFDQHKLLTEVLPGDGNGVYSDLSLTVLSSAMNPIHEVVFKDAYPSSLSSLVFDTKMQDVDYLEATVTFAYRSYTINSL